MSNQNFSNAPSNNSNNKPSDADNRQEFRLSTQLVVFLERVASQGDARASIAVCQTQNISANGLSVLTDQMLTPDTIVNACVQTLDYAHRFTLCIEVKWCRPTEQPDEFFAGLAIYESQDTDIIAWKEFIAQLCLNE